MRRCSSFYELSFFSDTKCIGELFLAIGCINIQQVFPNHTYRKPDGDPASSLRNKYNCIAGMCGFFLMFFFFIGGGECYCLYHCWYVNKIILVKMGRGTC